MARCEATEVTRVGIVGTGVIGGGWALHFLARGLDVIAFDPHPDARARMQRMLDSAWPSLEKLGLSSTASPDRLRFTDRLEDAVAEVDVVQESSPEVLDAKIEVFRQMDAVARPDTVLLSSTSGLSMTDMQIGCARPERTVVGHPFNPPYLIPLVEVVGGKKTDPAAVDWAADFYKGFGKRVVKLSKELPGFIASRLQEAMWREMLHMVANDEATVEEIDEAIVNGPGLRWAIMGPGMTFHVAGGEGGMAHVLDHFGPSLKWPWTRLEAPELTDELRRRMIEGCETEANGRAVGEIIRERDETLIEILNLLEARRTRNSSS
jgi:carnitine 3-dehydrogenase